MIVKTGAKLCSGRNERKMWKDLLSQAEEDFSPIKRQPSSS